MVYFSMFFSLVFILFFDLINAQYAQQVAPGVPPQQYQVPHQQQVPVQHMPVQQQVPVQHVQMQQPQQQGQPQQMHPNVQAQVHHHGGPGQHGQLLNAANIQQEKAHIAEHMEVPIDTSKMSDQELQFHYFKMHDSDNNNKLDGCELIKSLIHWHEQGHKDPNNPHKVEDKIFKNQELMDLIDPILQMDDTNNDGYIDYPEFIRAQQKASQAQQQQQQGNRV